MKHSKANKCKNNQFNYAGDALMFLCMFDHFSRLCLKAINRDAETQRLTLT